MNQLRAPTQISLPSFGSELGAISQASNDFTSSLKNLFSTPKRIEAQQQKEANKAFLRDVLLADNASDISTLKNSDLSNVSTNVLKELLSKENTFDKKNISEQNKQLLLDSIINPNNASNNLTNAVGNKDINLSTITSLKDIADKNKKETTLKELNQGINNIKSGSKNLGAWDRSNYEFDRNDFVSKLDETAKELGVSTEDLATVISFESAGTFDPTIAGPTTQHGTHKGLIQFGESQAAKYGVDFNDPINTQLGKDGAIVKYLRDNGYQNGMSLEQLYATINAGDPNGLNKSDTFNGGTAGTVLDKVTTQFAPHRENARKFLGIDSTENISNSINAYNQQASNIANSGLSQKEQDSFINKSQNQLATNVVNYLQKNSTNSEQALTMLNELFPNDTTLRNKIFNSYSNNDSIKSQDNIFKNIGSTKFSDETQSVISSSNNIKAFTDNFFDTDTNTKHFGKLKEVEGKNTAFPTLASKIAKSTEGALNLDASDIQNSLAQINNTIKDDPELIKENFSNEEIAVALQSAYGDTQENSFWFDQSPEDRAIEILNNFSSQDAEKKIIQYQNELKPTINNINRFKKNIDKEIDSLATLIGKQGESSPAVEKKRQEILKLQKQMLTEKDKLDKKSETVSLNLFKKEEEPVVPKPTVNRNYFDLYGRGR